jgi:hypothetical protein
MKSFDVGHCAFSISVAAVLLAGCGGSPAPLGPPGAVAQNERQLSTSGDLIYATDQQPATVWVYTYPNLKRVASFGLSGADIVYPGTECVDPAGNVFVTAEIYASNSSPPSGLIYEFAHGGTSPIATLDDPAVPSSCSVDPKTGDLAVPGFDDAGKPVLAIYDQAAGKPSMYRTPGLAFGSCAYDNDGNLYLLANANGGEAKLVRLAYGSTTFVTLNLGTPIYIGDTLPGFPSIQWVGTHLTVSSNPASNSGAPHRMVYELRIAGKRATVVRTTEISSHHFSYTGQLWIQANTVLGFSSGGKARRQKEGAITLWQYPQGGYVQRRAVLGGEGRFEVGLVIST